MLGGESLGSAHTAAIKKFRELYFQVTIALKVIGTLKEFSSEDSSLLRVGALVEVTSMLCSLTYVNILFQIADRFTER